MPTTAVPVARSALPPADHAAAAKSGALAATLCYFLWGLVPIYWKQLAGINPVELIAHRHFWSLMFVGVLVAAHGRAGGIRAALDGPRAVAVNLLSASFLTINWLIYVWG